MSTEPPHLCKAAVCCCTPPFSTGTPLAPSLFICCLLCPWLCQLSNE